MRQSGQVRVPLLCLARSSQKENNGLPWVNPGNVQTELLTKINRCLVDTDSHERSPQIQLIPRAATLKALKWIAFQVDGK